MTEVADENQIEEEDSGAGLSRYMKLGVGGLFLFMLLFFLAGVGIAIFADPQEIAPRLGIIRDTVLIIMVLEGIVIVFALVALVLQVTRLIVILRNDVQPILNNAQETTEIAKGTAQFVGKNVTRPIMSIQALIAASTTFIREIGGIRRAIHPRSSKGEKDHGEE
jgi:hypothetical protein